MFLLSERIEVADLVPQALDKMLSTTIDLNVDGKTYTCTMIFSTTDDCLMELNFPKVTMEDISMASETTRVGEWPYPNFKTEQSMTLHIGDGYVAPIDGIFFTMTDITEYREMTMREVEKELGYKIKIKA